MENVVHRLTLDLTKPDVFPRVEVQRDNARTLVVSLSQNGRPYWIAEGVTAVFSARKSDGKPLFNACTVEKNTVRYDFTDQTTNVPGIVECEILLYSGDERILASPRFELAVDDLIHQEGDVPESAPEVTALTQMVAAGTAMLEDLGELEEVLKQAERSASLASKMAGEAIAAQETALSAASDAETAANSASAHANQAGAMANLATSEADRAADRSKSASVKAQVAADAAGVAGEHAQEAADAASAAVSSAGRAEAAAKALENFEETDPTVPEWAKQPQKPTYTAQEVGADPEGTAVSNIETHNTGRYAHEDIRQELQALKDDLGRRYIPRSELEKHNVNPEAHQDIREKLDFDSGDDGQLLMVTGGRATPLPIGTGLEVRDGRLGVSGIVNLYVCSDGEYTPGGAPVIAEPDGNTAYLVPQDSEGTLYASWVYAGGVWEFVETLTVTFDEAEDGKDGEPGKDGVPVTHSWNGTVLSVTSASGTSSADLKGEPGKDGADGYTPVKGEDYFTPEEVREIAETAAGLVEVPSNEKWEIIYDSGDLTEAVKSITIRDLPALDKALFIALVEHENSGTSANQKMYCFVQGPGSGNYRFYSPGNVFYTQKTTIRSGFVAYIRTVAKEYLYIDTASDDDSNPIENKEWSPSATGRYYMIPYPNGFNYFNLASPYGTGYFGVGSRIIIYGVRK